MKKVEKEEYELRLKTRFPEENFNIIEYDGLGKKAIIECLKCHQKIIVNRANDFLAKNKRYGCKNCHGLWRNREVLLEQLKMDYNILSTSIKNTHTYYKIQCKKCGHIRDIGLNGYKKSPKCGCETNVFRNRTKQEVIETINRNSTNGKYEIIGEYKNQTIPILLRHLNCGFIWKVRPSEVINGRSSCPKCNHIDSKGERIIKMILTDLNIEFCQEKRLEGSLQRFDFYLENLKHKIAIEFNGKQHYEEVNFFHGTLAEQQKLDEKKKKYCENNEIDLYIIPYTLSPEEIKEKILLIINKFND